MRTAIACTTLLFSSVTAVLAHPSPVSIANAVQILDPTLTLSISYISPTACSPPPTGFEWICIAGDNPNAEKAIGPDAGGNTYSTGPDGGSPDAAGSTLYVTTPSSEVRHIAGIYRYRCPGDTSCGGDHDQYSYPGPPRLDLVNGRLLIAVYVTHFQGGYEAGVLQVDGLPKLFDTLLTFIPGQQAMSVLTPAHPDGFRSADSLQVWTGDVRSMPDWSQAQPLAYMAAQNPTPGQIVSVPDTLPAPTVGEGRYYLVASQSGVERRLGRQYVNGAFSARQPAGLPGCQ